MTILLSTAACLAAYLAFGWWLAKRDLPRAWALARQRWDWEDSILASVKVQTIATLLLWPAVLPARAANRALDQAVTDHDPREQEKQLRAQATRIKELERELGLGGDR